MRQRSTFCWGLLIALVLGVRWYIYCGGLEAIPVQAFLLCTQSSSIFIKSESCRYLAAKNIDFAKIAFSAFQNLYCDSKAEKIVLNEISETESSVEKQVYSDGFMNLTHLVLEVVQYDARDLFILVREHYKLTLRPYADLTKVGIYVANISYLM